jgi:hypothetical protein
MKVLVILHRGSQNCDICLGACLHDRISRASAQAHVSFDSVVVRELIQAVSHSSLILVAQQHSEKQGPIIKYTAHNPNSISRQRNAKAIKTGSLSIVIMSNGT